MLTRCRHCSAMVTKGAVMCRDCWANPSVPEWRGRHSEDEEGCGPELVPLLALDQATPVGYAGYIEYGSNRVVRVGPQPPPTPVQHRAINLGGPPTYASIFAGVGVWFARGRNADLFALLVLALTTVYTLAIPDIPWQTAPITVAAVGFIRSLAALATTPPRRY